MTVTGSNSGGTAGARSGFGQGAAPHSVDISADWLFGAYVPGAQREDFDDSGCERITVPHTVTDLSWRGWKPGCWEGTWIYRRHFDAPNITTHDRVFLDFGAAITDASVTLNDTLLGDHVGGYLPFSYELTGQLREGDNVLAVALNSGFDVNTPPNRSGEPSNTVDYWQPGGLYRPVRLRCVPPAFVADVFAKPVDVLDPGRRVDVRCTIDAATVPAEPARLRVELHADGRTIADETRLTLEENTRSTVDLCLTDLGDIRLWHPDTPTLYDVVVTLYAGSRRLHDHRTRIGFREARFTTDGFFLNGERLTLLGLNRHQIYPFAGHAMPDRVQRKDAEILRRDLNCTMVRCAHYPQSEAFFDACDELGLLAFEEVPGWGMYLGDQQWKDRAVRDVGDMITRDRNHPSIVIWGARLNECPDDPELFTRTRDLAHALDDSRPTTGAMLAGEYGSTDFVQDVFSYNDYTRADGHAALRTPRADFPYLVTEAVGTLSGGNQVYQRTRPAYVQQGQALAHAWVHEIAAADARHCGVLAWCGFDYPSGNGNQFEGVKYPGVVDLFREPKPGAAIYQAQIDPSVRPVIQPAFCWDFSAYGLPLRSGQQAMICSNCDRLDVFVDDDHVATLGPDRERFAHLPRPPFFVDLNSVDGSMKPQLRIDGYVGDQRVLTRHFSSDPVDDSLEVRCDDDELTADGADATRVVFRAVDRYGAPRPYLNGDVTLTINGPGQLLGDSPFAFGAAGGVGAGWIRTIPGSDGRIRVTATHPDLGSGTVTIHAR